jgi:beta-glucosidase
LNVGDKDYDPLFAYGYGLSYAKSAKFGQLSTDSGLTMESDLPNGTWFGRARTADMLSIVADGAAKMTAVDRNAQEDARRFRWPSGTEGAVLINSASDMNVARESNGELGVEIDLRVDAIADDVIGLSMACGTGCSGQIDLGPSLRAIKGQGWQSISVPLSCFAKLGVDMTKVSVPFRLSSRGPLDLTLSRIALGSTRAGQVGCAK